jgi:hypothetical protein
VELQAECQIQALSQVAPAGLQFLVVAQEQGLETHQTLRVMLAVIMVAAEVVRLWLVLELFTTAVLVQQE